MLDIVILWWDSKRESR